MKSNNIPFLYAKLFYKKKTLVRENKFYCKLSCNIIYKINEIKKCFNLILIPSFITIVFYF